MLRMLATKLGKNRAPSSVTPLTPLTSVTSGATGERSETHQVGLGLVPEAELCRPPETRERETGLDQGHGGKDRQRRPRLGPGSRPP